MAKKRPQVSSTASGTSELAVTSVSLGIGWHFACSWASLLPPRAGANNVGTQAAVTAASQHQAAAAAASEPRFPCQSPALPKTRKSRGLPLMCRERQRACARSLVGRTSCSAPGSRAAFCSVWISKLFNYFSASGAKGKNFIILGSLFSDGQVCFPNFFTHSVAASAFTARVKLNYDHMPCVRYIF